MQCHSAINYRVITGFRQAIANQKQLAAYIPEAIANMPRNRWIS